MKQLLTLDFKKEQGLILRWNCVNFSRSSHYFRHIIVLLVSNTEFARNALDGYVRNIKLGDLYTVVDNNKGVARVREWREKTNHSPNTGESYLKQQLGVSFSLEQACGIIEKYIQQAGEPTVVNFILQKQAEICNLKVKIREMQVAGKIKFISTIFSLSPHNCISISEGIGELCLDDRFVFNFFHHYLNQMALEYAHLSITCRNGEMNSCSQDDWRNTAFNKIERKYYGPSIRYVRDVLHFINSKMTCGGEYDLDIELNYRCFGGTTYTSYKHVAISFENDILNNRTVCATRKSRLYYATEDIALEENPYQSESLIHFELRPAKDHPCDQLQ